MLSQDVPNRPRLEELNVRPITEHSNDINAIQVNAMMWIALPVHVTSKSVTGVMLNSVRKSLSQCERPHVCIMSELARSEIAFKCSKTGK